MDVLEIFVITVIKGKEKHVSFKYFSSKKDSDTHFNDLIIYINSCPSKFEVKY